jgi:histone H3/H4
MAAKKKTAKKAAPAALIISKARAKEAVNGFNVSSEFYEALDAKVRELIAGAEERAGANSRKTLKAHDL